MAAHSYSFDACTLIIGGVIITGFAEGGVSFEPQADASSSEAGADGEVVTSYSADDRMTATITVQQQSRANRLLNELYQAQRQAVRQGIERPPLPFLFADPINGDKVSDAFAVFQATPSIEKGAEAGTNEWVILLPTARRTAILAGARL